MLLDHYGRFNKFKNAISKQLHVRLFGILFARLLGRRVALCCDWLRFRNDIHVVYLCKLCIFFINDGRDDPITICVMTT